MCYVDEMVRKVHASLEIVGSNPTDRARAYYAIPVRRPVLEGVTDQYCRFSSSDKTL